MRDPPVCGRDRGAHVEERDLGLSRGGAGRGVSSGSLMGEMETSSLAMAGEHTGFPAHGWD